MKSEWSICKKIKTFSPCFWKELKRSKFEAEGKYGDEGMEACEIN